MIDELLVRLDTEAAIYPSGSHINYLCRDARECIEELAASREVVGLEVVEDKVDQLIALLAERDKYIKELEELKLGD